MPTQPPQGTAGEVRLPEAVQSQEHVIWSHSYWSFKHGSATLVTSMTWHGKWASCKLRFLIWNMELPLSPQFSMLITRAHKDKRPGMKDPVRTDSVSLSPSFLGASLPQVNPRHEQYGPRTQCRPWASPSHQTSTHWMRCRPVYLCILEDNIYTQKDWDLNIQCSEGADRKTTPLFLAQKQNRCSCRGQCG